MSQGVLLSNGSARILSRCHTSRDKPRDETRSELCLLYLKKDEGLRRPCQAMCGKRHSLLK